ncbi:MAG: hypothetical protein PHX54_08420 [Lentimicrobiaceae bacterium]|nr:hypothetical protein [Lentimicrobiaceae bacterium]
MKALLTDSITALKDSLERYLELRLDLIKLSILSKISKISVFLITALVLVLLGSAFILFGAAAFVVWYGNVYGDYLSGLLIITGFILVLGILFYLIRRPLISSMIIKSFADILFENDDEKL